MNIKRSCSHGLLTSHDYSMAIFEYRMYNTIATLRGVAMVVRSQRRCALWSVCCLIVSLAVWAPTYRLRTVGTLSRPIWRASAEHSSPTGFCPVSCRKHTPSTHRTSIAHKV